MPKIIKKTTYDIPLQQPQKTSPLSKTPTVSRQSKISSPRRSTSVLHIPLIPSETKTPTKDKMNPTSLFTYIKSLTPLALNNNYNVKIHVELLPSGNLEVKHIECFYKLHKVKDIKISDIQVPPGKSNTLITLNDTQANKFAFVKTSLTNKYLINVQNLNIYYMQSKQYYKLTFHTDA